MKMTESIRTLSWEAAHVAVKAAVDHAQSLGIRINVAVVDASGLPAASLRMSGSPLHSAGIAEDKAYTAASFGLSTADWDGVVGENRALREGLVQRPRLVMFGGGLPVRHEAVCIGGIGVSGGSEEQDEACARAGLEAIGLA